jgi:signal transduction histidine kinase
MRVSDNAEDELGGCTVIHNLKHAIFLFLLILVFLLPAPALANHSMQWTNGYVDATGWDNSIENSITLSGEWEFYWEQLLSPESFQEQNQPLNPGFIQVPSQWGGLAWRDKPLTNQGYGTYRLQIELPTGMNNRTLAIYVRSVATSYHLYVNGELLAVNGRVGDSSHTMVARNTPQVIYFQPKQGINEIIIQVSNFVQRKGGIWEPIRLGDAQTITQDRNGRIIQDIFTFGCLFIMGIYHVGLYLFRKKDKAPLYFGVLCLAISARVLVLGETLVMSMLPFIPWEIGVKAEYLSVSIAFMMIVLFVNAQYPSRLSKLTNKVSWFIQLSIMCLILFTTANIYTHIMLPYQLLVALPTLVYAIAIYIRAARTREEGSVHNFIGFIMLATAVANDILYYNQVIATGSWIPLGLLFFLLTQSLNVASRFSKSFKTTETLSTQLQLTNTRLEQKVSERTASLSETNVRLEAVNMELNKSEQSRILLLANISHELNTPITSVKGFARAMMDDIIVAADYSRYARRIYDRTLLLERIIADLIELTKLETRQLSFHFEEQPALQLLRRMFDQYETELFEDNGNQLIWDDSAMTISSDQEVLIRVDVVRLEQVFSNLLSNARKYSTNVGDIRITIQLRALSEDKHSLIVQVIDPGPGIAEVDMPFIFNRFYRSKHNSSRQSGTGLGLTICKEIIEYHHGHIGYIQKNETESVFYFQLPARLIGLNPSA